MPTSMRKVTGLVGSANPNDYYAFSVTGTEYVSLTLNTTVSGANVYLYDASGNSITYNNSYLSGGTSTPGSVVSVLTPGRYYARVAGNSDTPYQLTVATGNPAVGNGSYDSGGNALTTASPFGFLSAATISIADYVGPSDQKDYYSFAVNATSTLNVAITGLTATAYAYLLDASGATISSFSGNAGTAILFSSILPALATGTYYLYVTTPTASSTGTGYNLALNATPIPDNAGNSLDQARALGTLTAAGTAVSDSLSAADRDDWYSFSLSSQSQVTFTLNGLSSAATASFKLTDAAGNQIGYSYGATRGDDGSYVVYLQPLSVGTYYVDVYSSYDSATAYTFTAAAAPVLNRGGASRASATVLTAGSVPASVTDFVGASATDYYGFTLDTATTLNLRLVPGDGTVRGYAGLSLVNAAGTVIAADSASFDRDGQVTASLGAGTYYAAVGSQNGYYENYTLTYFTGVPATGTAGFDGAGNTLAAARALGTLTASGTQFADYVGPGDTDDLYSFTLAGPTQVQFDAYGNTGYVNLRLLDASGAVLNSNGVSATYPGLPVSLVGKYGAGTYYLDVQNTSSTGAGYHLLTAGTAIPDIAGASLSTAYDIGALGAAARSFTDFVGAVDTTDTFKFTLGTLSALSLRLSGLTENTTVALLDVSGRQITIDGGDFLYNASINASLAAGTYFLRVSGNNSTNYTLSASAPAISDIAGPTIGTATNLNALGLQTRNDFNGDAKTDILWQNTSNGYIVDWTMNGPSITAGAYIGGLDASWNLLGTGDFNGDGKTDILWQNTGGLIVDWTMNGSTVASGAVVAALDSSWKLLGTGDLNADGQSDLIWRNTAGTVVDWQMSGAQIARSGIIGTLGNDWSLLGTGDFNGDGTSDLLWRNNNAGTIVEWNQSGQTVISTATVGALPTSWEFLAAADFNGDGISDMLWRNTDGTVVEWLMNGGSIVGGGQLATLDPAAWKFIGTGDLNGDGKADILWQNTAGAIVDWTMNGSSIASGAIVGTLDGSWKHLGS